jgi:hypothetical protein
MQFPLKLAQSAQPGERNSKISTKSPKFRSRGHFLGENASNGISSQNTLLNNFSPVQPILTRNTPMESPILAVTQGIIKNIHNSILGEQSGNFQKNYPLE